MTSGQEAYVCTAVLDDASFKYYKVHHLTSGMVCEIVQWIEVLATKPSCLNLSSEAPVINQENQLLQAVG